jgi:hypothetical protein
MNQSDSWYRGGNVTQSLGENYEQYLVPTIFGPWADRAVARGFGASHALPR